METLNETVEIGVKKEAKIIEFCQYPTGKFMICGRQLTDSEIKRKETMCATHKIQNENNKTL